MTEINDSKRVEKLIKEIATYLMIYVGILAVLSLIIKIDPTKEYNIWMGAIHGYIAPIKWIMSLFNDSILAKAPLHAKGYNLAWWIALILSIREIPRIFLQSILDFYHGSNDSGNSNDGDNDNGSDSDDSNDSYNSNDSNDSVPAENQEV